MLSLGLSLNRSNARKLFKNMAKYNPVTWVEWTKVGVVANSAGIEFTAVGNSSGSIKLTGTTFKISTKYGFIYNVVNNTMTGNVGLDGSVFSYNMLPKVVGNNKLVVTSNGTITTNQLYIYNQLTTETEGHTIKFKNFRVFELTPGSQIESNFTNLTADQLNAKYPMASYDIYGSELLGINYVGKISGSVIENPNKFMAGASQITLQNPSAITFENPQGYYDSIKILDVGTASMISTIDKAIPQQLFSFNLIADFEKKYGVIPSTTQSVADKIIWLKANITNSNYTSLRFNWTGYGSCPSGNKAKIAWWNGTAWINVSNSNDLNTSTTPTLLSSFTGMYALNNNNFIDTNGFAHFLAYTDMASTTSSTMLVLTGHELLSGDVIENVNRGAIVSLSVGINLPNPNQVIALNIAGQVSGDVINKYHRYSTTATAITGTTDTNIVVTAHGLVVGDIVYKGGVFRKVLTVIDVNTVTVASGLGATVGSTFWLERYYGQQVAEATVIPSTIYTDYVSLDITLKPSYKQ